MLCERQGSDDSALAETFVTKVVQNTNAEEQAGGCQKEPLIVFSSLMFEIEEVVAWVDVVACEFNWRRLAEEHLAVT